MRVQLDLDDTQISDLVRYAVLNGFTRENERKAWTEKERKEAVRYSLNDLAHTLS